MIHESIKYLQRWQDQYTRIIRRTRAGKIRIIVAQVKSRYSCKVLLGLTRRRSGHEDRSGPPSPGRDLRVEYVVHGPTEIRLVQWSDLEGEKETMYPVGMDGVVQPYYSTNVLHSKQCQGSRDRRTLDRLTQTDRVCVS